jgi:hypothetical protein
MDEGLHMSQLKSGIANKVYMCVSVLIDVKFRGIEQEIKRGADEKKKTVDGDRAY